MICRVVAVVVLLAACGRGEARPREEPAHDAAATPWHVVASATDAPCQRLPFAASLPIAEASGAAPLRIDGRDVLLINSDSGNNGAYLLIDAASGEVVERGALPLGDGASDDVEGIAAVDDVIWGVTSSGWVRAWTRVAHGFALSTGPYPLGHHLSCAAGADVNCGANLEGLCLAPTAAVAAPHPRSTFGPCAGFVASKTDGHLYCVGFRGGRLIPGPAGSLAVADPGALADCAFDPAGDALWVGGNAFDGAEVSRVTGWRDLGTATVTPLGSLGDGFPEAIAVGADDVVYRLSDTGGAPSLAGRWRCDFAR